MQTITFSAIKGGVGKSSLAILTANCLASTGKRVLVVDADPQNSTTFYYNPDSLDIVPNLANILNGRQVRDNIIPTAINNISLIPSSLDLIKCRDCDDEILLHALKSIASEYDICVMDTAPTFDNVVLNCINAGDKIIIPVQFSSFDYKSALFYRGLLQEAGAENKFQIAFNKFKRIQTGTSINAQFLNAYNEVFGKVGQVVKARIPDSAVIRQYFDTGSSITKSKSKINVLQAIVVFTEEISGLKINPEAF